MIIIIFFYQDFIVHHECAQNQQFYLEVLRIFHDTLHNKRPRKCQSGAWKIHYDKLLTHSTQIMHQFLATHQIPQVC
jgi:hypothetical protein